jgi:antigen 43
MATVTVSGSGVSSSNVSAGKNVTVNVLSGGTTIHTSVTSTGVENVSAGSIASGSIISSGGTETVLTGGTEISATIGVSGTANISSGGTASGDIIQSGGKLNVLSSGTASGTTISAGTMTVSLTGKASATTILSGGKETILGTDVSATIGSSGTVTVSSGGLASAATISTGGTLSVLASGTASATTVLSGGKETILGTDMSATISSGGSAVVSSGGTASATTISNGGVEIVSASGKAISAVLLSGGTVEVLSGFTSDSITTWSSGGTLAIGSGVTVSAAATGGTISGGQILAILASGTAISNTISSGGIEIVSSGGTASATVLSNGGTLEVLGGFTKDTIGTWASGGTLAIGSGVTVSAAATGGTISGGQILAILSSGTAISNTISSGGIETVSSGGLASATTISTGGTLSVLASGTASATTILSGGKEAVLGTDVGATIRTGGTEIVSSGGTASATTISGGTLDLQTGSIVSGGVTFAASTSGGTLEFENAAQTSTTTISGLNIGTTSTTPLNEIDLRFISSGAITSTTISGSTLTVFISGGTSTTLHLNQAPTSGTHVDWISDGNGGSEIFLSDVPCYVAGTRILTAHGEIEVERLTKGDKVITLVDGKHVEQPVTWLGARRLNLKTHPRPNTVMPIRITRDAFGDDLPCRDLLVSPDHAIFVEGVLICARQLVNGTTIQQVTEWTAVDYYHVQFDKHAVILAEGLPAESYLDTGNLGFFQNSGDPLQLHPDLTDATDLPSREAGSCAPFVWKSERVQPIWQRLAERAAALGRPVPVPATTTDPELRLVIKERQVKPIYCDDKLFIFPVPQGAQTIRLVSRSGSPTETRPWIEDRRQLGVRVKQLVLRSADELREIPLDHPALAEGWWAVERDGTALRRWTIGEAVLPLPTLSGPTMLEVHIGDPMNYVVPVTEQNEDETVARRA